MTKLFLVLKYNPFWKIFDHLFTPLFDFFSFHFSNFKTFTSQQNIYINHKGSVPELRVHKNTREE